MLIKDPVAAPWLTIVLPVFNVKPYLEACLRSIVADWEGDIEIIAVEDCSTDDSAAELHRLAQETPLRIIQHERNRGLSSARNTGLEAATGAYIWFLDSDDFLQPGAIKGLKQVVDQYAPDVVMCDFRMHRQRITFKHRLRGELHRRTFDGPSRVLGRDMMELMAGSFSAGHLHTWSKVAKRSLWGDSLRFPEGRYFEDARTTPELLSRAESWYHVPETWVSYRQREGSILNKMDLSKLNDLTSAFIDFLPGFNERYSSMPRSCAFDISHHCARTFVGASKHMRRMRSSGEVQALIRANRLRFLATSPLTLTQLSMDYLRRGWLLRMARLIWHHHVAARIDDHA